MKPLEYKRTYGRNKRNSSGQESQYLKRLTEYKENGKFESDRKKKSKIETEKNREEN